MSLGIPSSPLPTGFDGPFVPKLVSVLREGYGLAALRADAVAGLTVAIVALPLSMAIAIASGHHAGARAVHRHRRRLPDLGTGRQPLPGGRSRGRLHRAGGCDGRPARGRGHAARDADGRGLPGGGRCAAARHLREVHPLSGDGGLHSRHRRHHPRQPAQGSVRPHPRRQGAGRVRRQARSAGGRGRDPERGGRRPGRDDDRRSSWACESFGRTGRACWLPS